MATEKSVGDPLGADKKPGSDAQVDAKEYVMYVVESTLHKFYAPRNKYKDIDKALGLKEVKPNSNTARKAKKMAGGQGYVRLMAKLSNGANMSIVCDPAKLGEVLGGGSDDVSAAENDKIYGVTVSYIYLPKKVSYR
jgi:hypothetical protein